MLVLRFSVSTYCGVLFFFFFFFQAEDGIRDVAVTGVQTCALPIFRFSRGSTTTATGRRWRCWLKRSSGSALFPRRARERKSGVEGKRGDLGGRRIIKKKKKKKKQKTEEREKNI